MPKTYAYQHHHSFPYFKVQYWDEISLCWLDVQKVSYKTKEEAKKNFIIGKKCRIMCVEENGRYPIEEK